MAKHRMTKSRRARKAVLAGAAAAGISSALVLGHATNTTAASSAVELANTVIGVGGLGDNTGVRLPNKLSGTVVPAGYQYAGLQYDSGLNLAASRDAGTPLLNQAIVDTYATEPLIVVTAYSAGTLTVEQVRRNLQQLDPSLAPLPTQLSFVQIANPFAPNGGLFQRFPGIAIPGLIDAMCPGQATRYDTTYIANEYDPYGDFPAYFNPLSLLNTVLSLRYSHPDEAYDPLVPGTSPAYVTQVHNTAGGTDTYVLYYRALPLLGPLRELARQTGTSPFAEPFISAVEPLLRLLVDMGYTDRVNADPATPIAFSLIVPPQNVIGAFLGLPGAISQGVTNLLSGGTAPTTLPDPLGNLVPAAPTPLVAPQIQGAQSRMTLVGNENSPTPTASSVPTATPTVTPDSSVATGTESTSSTPSSTASATPSSTASATPPTTASNPPSTTSRPGPTGDGLHPTVTSDGNMAVPGGGTDPAGPATGGATTTTTTGTNGSTTGTGAGESGGDDGAGEANAA